MTVIMKVDPVGLRQRGLALGLNEFAGDLSVGMTARLTGYLASQYALRPQPFHLGIGFIAAGLLLSWFWVQETRGYALFEAGHLSGGPTHTASAPQGLPTPSLRDIFVRTSWTHPTLFACSQAGPVNNLNDALSWGLYPLFFSS